MAVCKKCQESRVISLCIEESLGYTSIKKKEMAVGCIGCTWLMVFYQRVRLGLVGWRGVRGLAGGKRGGFYRTMSARKEGKEARASCGRRAGGGGRRPRRRAIGWWLVEISTAKPGHSTSASNSNSQLASRRHLQRDISFHVNARLFLDDLKTTNLMKWIRICLGNKYQGKLIGFFAEYSRVVEFMRINQRICPFFIVISIFWILSVVAIFFFFLLYSTRSMGIKYCCRSRAKLDFKGSSDKDYGTHGLN